MKASASTIWCGMTRSGSTRRELVDKSNERARRNLRVWAALTGSELGTKCQIPTTSPALTSDACRAGWLFTDNCVVSARVLPKPRYEEAPLWVDPPVPALSRERPSSAPLRQPSKLAAPAGLPLNSDFHPQTLRIQIAPSAASVAKYWPVWRVSIASH